MKENVVGAFVKANKKVSGKTVVLYGMIDGTYFGGESYGLITADEKDGSWTSCLINPADTTFLTNKNELAIAKRRAQLYIDCERADLEHKIARLEAERKTIEQLAALVNG